MKPVTGVAPHPHFTRPPPQIIQFKDVPYDLGRLDSRNFAFQFSRALSILAPQVGIDYPRTVSSTAAAAYLGQRRPILSLQNKQSSSCLSSLSQRLFAFRLGDYTFLKSRRRLTLKLLFPIIVYHLKTLIQYLGRFADVANTYGSKGNCYDQKLICTLPKKPLFFLLALVLMAIASLLISVVLMKLFG